MSFSDWRVVLRTIVIKIRSEECDRVSTRRTPGQEIGDERADQPAVGSDEPSVHRNPALKSVRTLTALHQPARRLHEGGIEPLLISQRAIQRMNALMEIEVRRFSFAGHCHHPGHPASYKEYRSRSLAGLAAHVLPAGKLAGRNGYTTPEVRE